MRLAATSLLSLATLLSAAPLTQPADPPAYAVDRGIKWLVSVQGKDGGWGQDGGETSYIRNGERLESNGNDVANTAVAVQALVHSGSGPVKGPYSANVRRGVEFLLRNVEASQPEGLTITSVNGTQIQRKLGPFIDTFLTSMLLAELDGNMGDAQANARVRRALSKVVAKIQTNQQKDGSWNNSGGWAPILGTSMASRSLYAAQKKGVKVEEGAMARVDSYTKSSAAVTDGRFRPAAPASASSAGVVLYQGAQTLEQLSRTPEDRAKNSQQINAIRKELSDAKFSSGFGSIGGEEFFSYLNISDSLHRTGGEEWTKWNSSMKTRIVGLQNEDGTWAGHHCITGRVAVTGAAILTLLVDREPVR